MRKKIYLDTLKSALGRSIFHYLHDEKDCYDRKKVSDECKLRIGENRFIKTGKCASIKMVQRTSHEFYCWSR